MRSGFSVRSNSNGKPEVKVENPNKNESELPTIETLFIHLIIFWLFIDKNICIRTEYDAFRNKKSEQAKIISYSTMKFVPRMGFQNIGKLPLQHPNTQCKFQPLLPICTIFFLGSARILFPWPRNEEKVSVKVNHKVFFNLIEIQNVSGSFFLQKYAVFTYPRIEYINPSFFVKIFSTQTAVYWSQTYEFEMN